MALLCGSIDQAKRWIDAGVKIIAFSSDVGMLQQAYRTVVERLRPGS
jgi:2-keto-3-deoxy-L-rhamnonate aldolase RhmA